MSNLTKTEYSKYVDKITESTNIYKNMAWAFIVGGLICTLGQFIVNIIKSLGFDINTANDINTVIMIFLGAFLTGLGVYDNLGKYAGAGSIVPITGFANSIVAPAIEFKPEGYIFGIGAKMFVIAGPVLVYGIITSTAIGLIYYLLRL